MARRSLRGNFPREMGTVCPRKTCSTRVHAAELTVAPSGNGPRVHELSTRGDRTRGTRSVGGKRPPVHGTARGERAARPLAPSHERPEQAVPRGQETEPLAGAGRAGSTRHHGHIRGMQIMHQ